MKKLLVLLSLFAAVPAVASEQSPRVPEKWSDITDAGIYYLTQVLPIDEKVSFPEGTKFDFMEVTGGGGLVPVMFFELRAKQCANPEATSEILLMNPTGGKGEEIGVELHKNCEILFYVEDTLVGLPSIFTSSAE
ncbi:MAG TPA: hypothetical protein VF412_12030 [Bdellovibrio sp.]|uniref:hypothetical protein n=1 Tax=Bdellovibrio sp. TaxID=28201 RepID=UPI002F110392